MLIPFCASYVYFDYEETLEPPLCTELKSCCCTEVCVVYGDVDCVNTC